MTITTTPRLLIREIEQNDLDALVPILSDPEVMQYSTRGPISREEIITWIDNVIAEYNRLNFSVWAIILQEENKLIGYCGIRPIDLDGKTEIEIMFRLAKNYWNQGYAFEATKAAQQYAFDTLAINSIIAIVDPQNVRSLNVIDKLQMIYEKDSVYKNFPIRVYRLNKFKEVTKKTTRL